jgi:iron complex outermembrane receptor protein
MSKLFGRTHYFVIILILFSYFFIVNNVRAESDATIDSDELPSLDFDALLAADVQVTSAMKRLQNKSDTAAAIYVLTNKEIMQSGVTSVAQALTLIPGMQVRKIDNNQWAITSRSVAGRHSSKLLVMVDGHSIFNPAFAGVYWEALNIPLYDIERIEVIRGQGGLLWGSNATNGVVNIISKHTADTRNTVVQASTATNSDYKADFRVGGDLANYSSFRIFGNIEESDASPKSARSISDFGLSPNDSAKKQSVGGRVDLNINDDLSFITQGWYNHVDMGQSLKLADLNDYTSTYKNDRYSLDYLQLMGRFEHRLSSVSNQMLQVSMSSQRGEQVYYHDNFLTTDIDYQMNTLINGVQLDWGLTGRYSDVAIEDTDYVTSINHINSYHHFGGFAQAQFNLLPNQLKLILGNRSERNSFTGWEHQPMARLLWTPHSNHTVWGAVSQGVRIPSFLEYNYSALTSSSSSFGLPVLLTGDDEMDAETSISKELGYRYTDKSWNFDISLFHTKARDVMVVEDPTLDLSIPAITLDFVSDAKLTTYGGESVVKWQPTRLWSAELGYSFTAYRYDLPAGTNAAIGYDTDLNQIIAKSNFALTEQHDLFFVYRIEDGSGYDTKDFAVLDVTWNWQVSPSVTFSVSGNNLLYGKHIEYSNYNETYTVPTYIAPTYQAKIMAKF